MSMAGQYNPKVIEELKRSVKESSNEKPAQDEGDDQEPIRLLLVEPLAILYTQDPQVEPYRKVQTFFLPGPLLADAGATVEAFTDILRTVMVPASVVPGLVRTMMNRLSPSSTSILVDIRLVVDRLPNDNEPKPTSPETRWNLINRQRAAPSVQPCPICLVDIPEGSGAIKLPCRCKIWFHKLCISQWLRTNGICPTCRREF